MSFQQTAGRGTESDPRVCWVAAPQGAGSAADRFGNHALEPGLIARAKSVGGAAVTVAVGVVRGVWAAAAESRNEKRPIGTDDFQQRVDRCLSPAFDRAEPAQGAVHHDAPAARHAQVLQVTDQLLLRYRHSVSVILGRREFVILNPPRVKNLALCPRSKLDMVALSVSGPRTSKTTVLARI